MMNWPFDGWILDDTHWVGEFVDKEGNKSWQMITFNSPMVDGVIDGDAGFSAQEIDPNDFEWNGRRYILELSKVTYKV